MSPAIEGVMKFSFNSHKTAIAFTRQNIRTGSFTEYSWSVLYAPQGADLGGWWLPLIKDLHSETSSSQTGFSL